MIDVQAADHLAALEQRHRHHRAQPQRRHRGRAVEAIVGAGVDGDHRLAAGGAEIARTRRLLGLARRLHADADLERVIDDVIDAATIERNRKGELDKQAEALKAAEAELAAIAARLAPLIKEAEAVRKKGDELRATLARQDDLLRAQDAKAVAMRGKADRAAVDAEIATLRADRVAIAKDEPALAAQLAELAPRIAALEAERAASRARRRPARSPSCARSPRSWSLASSTT